MVLLLWMFNSNNMAHARLHLICGNCGCADNWTWEISKDANDYEDIQTDDVYILCGNCTTLHSLTNVTNYDPKTNILND